MKLSIAGLQLERKIVFVPRNPHEFLAISSSHNCTSIVRIEIFVRIHDGITNFLNCMRTSIFGEIVTHEPPRRTGHMTCGATSFPVKERFTSLRIAGRAFISLAALQPTEVIDDGID